MYNLEVSVYPTENYGFALQKWQILRWKDYCNTEYANLR